MHIRRLPQLRAALTAAVAAALLAGPAALPSSAEPVRPGGALSAASAATQATRADEPPGGLAPTPPLGWSSWNTFGCSVDEEMIRESADAMISSGMAEAGYEYVNIDDCWMAPERDADGNLQPDPDRFPHGIRALADYVHARGLKLGIYSSAGTMTCQELPASLGHEQEDARMFAEWQVDQLKYDNCHNEGVPAIERYTAMADAIADAGRPILLNLCEWGDNEPWLWASDIAEAWRTAHDIRPTWNSVMSILDQQVGLEEYSGPNDWNDPDSLEVGNAGLSLAESRAHMSLWALLNAPLIAGNDLRSMPAQTHDLLTDPDVLAVNQDWGGIQGHRISQDGDYEVWAKPMSGGAVAVVLLNRGSAAANLSTSPDALGLDSARAYRMTDVWSDAVTQTRDRVEASVPAHGARMFLVERSRPTAEEPDVTVGVSAGEGGYAAPEDPFTAEVTITNHGFTSVRHPDVDLLAPTGWEVTAAGNAPVVVPPGASRSIAFEVTAPVQTEVAWYDLDAEVTYAGRGQEGRERTGAGSVAIATALRGDSYLSDLEPLRVNVGYRDGLGLDQSNDGNPITIGGTVYDKGVAAHAASELDYYLGGECTRLSAEVGIDDEVGDKGEVTFAVIGDGEVLATTEVVTGADPAIPLAVDVSGVDVLTIAAGSGPDGSINNDHATWAGARVECAGPVAEVAGTPEQTVTATAGGTVEIGASATMTEGAADDVSVGVYPPAGWQVTGEPVSAARLADGEAISGQWNVRLGPDAEPGDTVEVPIVAAYHDEQGTLAVSRTTVRVLVLPDGWIDGREAEDSRNELAGEGRIRACDACSGGGKVGYLGGGVANTLSVTLTVPEAGEYGLVIDHLIKGTRDLEVSVNGEAPTTVTTSGTSFWVVQSVTVPVQLQAGENVIELGNTDDDAPDLDRIGIVEG